MKEQLKRITGFLMVALLAFTFSSCEDDEIAQQLDGIWEGEVSSTYFDHRWGAQTQYQYVDIEFYVSQRLRLMLKPTV